MLKCLQQFKWRVTLFIFDFPRCSELQHLFHDLFVDPVIFLVVHESHNGQVEGSIALVVAVVDGRSEAEESLDVAFLDVHDRVVQRCCSVSVDLVWIETLEMFL